MHTYKNSNKGVFAPVLVTNIGLSEHNIKHLQHLNQIPPSAPRQGTNYFQAKNYLA